MKKHLLHFQKVIWLVIFLFSGIYFLSAQENDDCFMCHDDPGLTSENPNRKGSLYVQPGALDHSVHKNVKGVFS